MTKKLLRILCIVAVIALIYLIQLTIIDNNSLFGIKPNLILISVITVAVWYGMYRGSFYALIIGLITDFIFFNSKGIFTISYTVVGIVTGYLSTKYMRENKISLIYITIIATALFEVTQYFIYLIDMGINSSIFYLIFKQIIVSSLLNIVIVYILYEIFNKIIKNFDSDFRAKRYNF